MSINSFKARRYLNIPTDCAQAQESGVRKQGLCVRRCRRWRAVETAPGGDGGRHETRLRGLGLLQRNASSLGTAFITDLTGAGRFRGRSPQARFQPPAALTHKPCVRKYAPPLSRSAQLCDAHESRGDALRLSCAAKWEGAMVARILVVAAYPATRDLAAAQSSEIAETQATIASSPTICSRVSMGCCLSAISGITPASRCRSS